MVTRTNTYSPTLVKCMSINSTSNQYCNFPVCFWDTAMCCPEKWCSEMLAIELLQHRTPCQHLLENYRSTVLKISTMQTDWWKPVCKRAKNACNSNWTLHDSSFLGAVIFRTYSAECAGQQVQYDSGGQSKVTIAFRRSSSRTSSPYVCTTFAQFGNQGDASPRHITGCGHGDWTIQSRWCWWKLGKFSSSLSSSTCLFRCKSRHKYIHRDLRRQQHSAHRQPWSYWFFCSPHQGLLQLWVYKPI